MLDEKQYEQLMLLYNQLKNGGEEISKMIDIEDFDNAIIMINSREGIFKNCKAIRRYLELTPIQQKEVDNIFEEIKLQEQKNIEKIKISMKNVQKEIKKSQQDQKIKDAYDLENMEQGSIIDIEEL